ncbi:MAG: hypothetical protein IKM27_00985, partial [Clostridia bacterium]|nr:hypothetical protein [Clostridia bacterium]
DPRELYLLWIYNGSETATIPHRIRIEINGEYVIDDLRTQSSPNAANVISLSNLPEGTKVHTIKIFLTPQDGKDASSICEILLQYISK